MKKGLRKQTFVIQPSTSKPLDAQKSKNDRIVGRDDTRENNPSKGKRFLGGLIWIVWIATSVATMLTAIPIFRRINLYFIEHAWRGHHSIWDNAVTITFLAILMMGLILAFAMCLPQKYKEVKNYARKPLSQYFKLDFKLEPSSAMEIALGFVTCSIFSFFFVVLETPSSFLKTLAIGLGFLFLLIAGVIWFTKKSAPASWNPKWNQAVQSFDNGKYHRAIDAFQALLTDLNANNGEKMIVWYNIAICYDKLDDPKGALAAYDQAINLEKSYNLGCFATAYKAIYLAEKGQIQKALQLYQELQSRPNLTSDDRETIEHNLTLLRDTPNGVNLKTLQWNHLKGAS